MTGLTVKQKKLLDRWFEEHKDSVTCFTEAKDLPTDLWNELEYIRDHEMLYHFITAYITDKI